MKKGIYKGSNNSFSINEQNLSRLVGKSSHIFETYLENSCNRLIEAAVKNKFNAIVANLVPEEEKLKAKEAIDLLIKKLINRDNPSNYECLYESLKDFLMNNQEFNCFFVEDFKGLASNSKVTKFNLPIIKLIEDYITIETYKDWTWNVNYTIKFHDEIDTSKLYELYQQTTINDYIKAIKSIEDCGVKIKNFIKLPSDNKFKAEILYCYKRLDGSAVKLKAFTKIFDELKKLLTDEDPFAEGKADNLIDLISILYVLIPDEHGKNLFLSTLLKAELPHVLKNRLINDFKILYEKVDGRTEPKPENRERILSISDEKTFHLYQTEKGVDSSEAKKFMGKFKGSVKIKDEIRPNLEGIDLNKFEKYKEMWRRNLEHKKEFLEIIKKGLDEGFSKMPSQNQINK